MVQFSGFRSGAELRRVRVRGTSSDPLRARQALERALAAVDWLPPQLPPRAVLLVRRLIVGAPARGGFGRDVTKALRQRADAARRPWVHADAGTADAVIFADEAELVACLVRDWLRGALAERWWWRDVLAGASAEEWLRRHALPRGDVFVPAMSLLGTRHEAVAAIARLADADACVAVRAIARAFGLPVVESSGASSGIDAPRGTDREDTPVARRAKRDALAAKAGALRRLMETAPEIRDPRLGPEQRRLAAVVMATLRDPSWTRAPEFALAVAALDRIEVLAAPPPSRSRAVPQPVTERVRPSGTAAPAGSDPVDVPKPAARVIDRSRATETAPGKARTRIGCASALRQSAIEPAGTRGPHGRRRQSRTSRDSAASPSSDPRTVGAAPAVEKGEDHLELDRPLPQPSPRTDAVVVPTASGARLETDFGGIFYLLNAWIAMGLYGDFTAPRAENLALSPWDLLALVGRAWFGDAFTGDAVWTLLAGLALRDPDDEPDRDRVLPDGWLEQHLDVLTTCLQVALGQQRDNVPSVLCRHRARIETSASALDVHLSLSDLPLEIRIAGLDRDPGWVPAAGRAVAFHFN